MIGGVIVTHGILCKELLETVKRIVGKIRYVEPVSIGWDDNIEEGKKHIREAIKKVDRGAGVIIFTDMFGGTPSNLSFSFLEKDQIEVITGVNLPMLLKFTFVQKSTELKTVAESVCKEGKASIYLASNVYKGRNND